MELSFGQKIDPENNLVMPWFTHKALNEIAEMDLRDKNVIMWGGGAGDVWLAKRCKELKIIERTSEWLDKGISNMIANGITNLEYIHRPCKEGDSDKYDFYTEIPEGFVPDVVINDDIMRFEVIEKALTLPRPIILITDNWMQSYVFMCPSAVELLKDFEQHIYEQEDHTDNDGVNKWKTNITFLR